MAIRELDALDRRILYMLQEETRHTSSIDIAEVLGGSANTVRNRIQRLEANAVIRATTPTSTPRRRGSSCSRSPTARRRPGRKGLAAAAELPDAVEAHEIMTGEVTIPVLALGIDGDDLSQIGRELDGFGFRILDEDIIRRTHRSPYAHFGDAGEE
jgi:DNA-binding Lrp family transcriptional regulator